MGWTATSFAALGARPPGDAAAVAQLVTELENSGLPLPAGKPLAVLFPVADCACPDARGAWQRTAQTVRKAGGSAIEASDAVSNSGNYQLLVLAANREPIYAGPLSPPAWLCGRTAETLSDLLPALLSATAPPLLLSPQCSC